MYGASLSILQRKLKNIENRSSRDDKYPEVNVELRGANLEIQDDASKEILLVGAAGTGKTTACLKKLYDICMANSYARVALVRKTRASLIETALVTFEQHILGYGHPLLSGSSRQNRMSYRFPNNSQLNIVGMDKPDRVLSADYDIIYICQAEELDESDAEALMSRLRNGRVPFQQLMMDCNPQSQSHWLFQRQLKGKLKMMTSKHQDNPKFYDIDKNEWTQAGMEYKEMLGSLSGVRYKRLFLGQWVSAEGAVYDFDRNKHTIPFLPTMKKYICGVDWGHRDAGAMVVVGQGVDSKLYVVEEIMRTGKTLQFWEGEAFRMMKQYPGVQFFCDPSIQAHIQAFMVHGIPAFKAFNRIEIGVDLIQQRLGSDGFKIYTGSCKLEDSGLRDKRLPTTLMEEMEGYVWNETRDMPKDGNNHALDALRYAVVAFDRPRANVIPVTSYSQPMYDPRKIKRNVPRRYRTTNR